MCSRAPVGADITEHSEKLVVTTPQGGSLEQGRGRPAHILTWQIDSIKGSESYTFVLCLYSRDFVFLH